MGKATFALILVCLVVSVFAKPVPEYASSGFKKLIAESFQYTRTPNPASFYSLMDEAAKRAGNRSFSSFVKQERVLLDSHPKQRSTSILSISRELHSYLKKCLPTFTLDRGFEFANAATRGERQCLLQSVLVAGLLREMKLNSGIAMVWKNDKGGVSNMGHVCALVDLPGGKAVVDCSDPVPFIPHQGLFLYIRDAGYRFVEPHYRGPIMTSVKDLRTGKFISMERVQTLDLDYVRSQFDFYRGERAPGGVLQRKSTGTGLAQSEASFRKSLKENSSNPLSTWLLSQTLSRLKKPAEAASMRARAIKLYQEFGWLPPSLR